MKGDPPPPQPQEECLMLEEGWPAGPPVGHTVLALSPRAKGAIRSLHAGGGAQTALSWTRGRQARGRFRPHAVPASGTHGAARPFVWDWKSDRVHRSTTGPPRPARCRGRAHLSALWFLSTPTPTHTPVPPTPLVRRRSSWAAGSGHVCFIYMKHEAEADGRARPRHAVCYTTYAFVPLCMLCTRH